MPVPERHDPLAPTRIERGGRRFDVDAVPVAVVTAGDTAFTAWGDGQVRAFRPGAEPEALPVHGGAVLSMAAEASGTLLTGGDDGRFCRISPDGVTEIAAFPRKWVDHVAAGAEGVLACSAGREVHLWDGPRQEVLAAPSTVGGLAFDRRGARLAVILAGTAEHPCAPLDWLMAPGCTCCLPASHPRRRLMQIAGGPGRHRVIIAAGPSDLCDRRSCLVLALPVPVRLRVVRAG